MRHIHITCREVSERTNETYIRELNQDEIDAVFGGLGGFNYGGIYSLKVDRGTATVFARGRQLSMGWSEDGDTFNMSHNGDSIELEHMGNDIYDLRVNGVGVACTFIPN